MVARPRVAARRSANQIGTTSSAKRTIAAADAVGQSRLAKKSFHIVRPIISVSEPPSRSGMTNSPIAGMKTSREPAMMPGSASGTVIVANARRAAGAEIARGFEKRRIAPLQRIVDRQDHERQIGVDDAEHDGAVACEKIERRRDEAQRVKRMLQRAVVLDERGERIDADQKARPERRHRQREQAQDASAGWLARWHRRRETRPAA